VDTNILRITSEKSSANSRAERALQHFEGRGHLIRAVAADTYEVPSCGMLGKRYTVRYGGLEESCSCPDFAYRGEACKHLLCVGIAHAARRSGVKVRTISVAGDPFKAAARRRRRECPACFGGCVTMTVEEDDQERHEAVPCRRCQPANTEKL
jgi:predicted nucleic acid-binding Zn finger protein